ncbi:Zn-ribbon domain-containing OB-fold protein [Natrinema halophilum]|uniref:OB-fold domain-containing protein n=1 Tax=Natrinema halophilum TaxID=1699371 RepID=A0A7D5KN26_9EURY|nr:OB-fold domain-containing protein [Natrinema halophilum]QLG51298.1 OB-fold domain-containing protein [Natrinema halophilum]
MSRFPATRCANCGTVYGHRVSVCRECHADEMESHPISGRGTVYATTTIRVPSAKFEGDAPYEVCIVDVGTDEPVRVTARLTDREDPEPGDEVRFVERQNGTIYFEIHG